MSTETSKPVIVVAERFNDSAMARLREAGEVVELNRPAAPALLDALANAQALLVRTYTQVTKEILEAAPKLQVIGRGGVGLDNIDLAAAKSRGIEIVYTPAAATDSVADHTLALILALERKILPGAAAVSSAETFRSYRGSIRLRELREMTVGIVGMGRIGSAVGRRCSRGFGMTVLYSDIKPVGPFDFPATEVSKEQLYAESDVVTLHVPLTDETRDLIDRDSLQHFGAGTVLINTSRGAVVDGAALAEALTAGRLAGAALDVFNPEPPEAGDLLLDAPNTVLTPHVAARSGGGLDRMNDVVDDVITLLNGGSANYPADL